MSESRTTDDGTGNRRQLEYWNRLLRPQLRQALKRIHKDRPLNPTEWLGNFFRNYSRTDDDDNCNGDTSGVCTDSTLHEMQAYWQETVASTLRSMLVQMWTFREDLSEETINMWAADYLTDKFHAQKLFDDINFEEGEEGAPLSDTNAADDCQGASDGGLPDAGLGSFRERKTSGRMSLILPVPVTPRRTSGIRAADGEQPNPGPTPDDGLSPKSNFSPTGGERPIRLSPTMSSNALRKGLVHSPKQGFANDGSGWNLLSPRTAPSPGRMPAPAGTNLPTPTGVKSHTPQSASSHQSPGSSAVSEPGRRSDTRWRSRFSPRGVDDDMPSPVHHPSPMGAGLRGQRSVSFPAHTVDINEQEGLLDGCMDISMAVSPAASTARSASRATTTPVLNSGTPPHSGRSFPEDSEVLSPPHGKELADRAEATASATNPSRDDVFEPAAPSLSQERSERLERRARELTTMPDNVKAHYMKDTSKPDKSDVESPFRPIPRARRSNSIDTGVLFTTVAPTPQARTKPWQDLTGIVPTA